MSPARTALITLGCIGVAGCDLSGTASSDTNKQVQNGDPVRGRAIIANGVHGCTACHTIPGIRFPRGVVGPPLGGMAQRAFIAGQLPNTPDNMMKWIQDPQGAAPGTLMPNMHVTDRDARDIAAYLYTLRVDR